MAKTENPAEYLHPARPGESVSYNMWDLAGIALLVRTSSHGFLRNMRQQVICLWESVLLFVIKFLVCVSLVFLNSA